MSAKESVGKLNGGNNALEEELLTIFKIRNPE